jgi:hypothetical protein
MRDKRHSLMRSLYHSFTRSNSERLSSLVKIVVGADFPPIYSLSSLQLEENAGMAGVEAAGFVLGILPLIISTAEHYEDVFRPFERYRKFAIELDLYQQQLRTQKTIFRNECRLLLATLTNRQTVKDMLKEGKHPSWEDPDLNERFSIQLGDSGAACKNIINLIQGKLKEVEEKTENFGSVIQQSIPVRPQIQLHILH